MIASMFASWCYQGRISDETINLLTPHYGPFDTGLVFISFFESVLQL